MRKTLSCRFGNFLFNSESEVKCDRLVVFGDGVQNAHEDLKKYATAIIPSNDEDGVAKWLDSTFHGPFPDFI